MTRLADIFAEFYELDRSTLDLVIRELSRIRDERLQEGREENRSGPPCGTPEVPRDGRK
jgi:hypothetical protein